MLYKFSPAVFSVFLLAVSAVAQPASKAVPSRPTGPDARGVMGGGRAVRVEDITPGSKLRGQIEGLPPQARATALAKLESLSFHKNDIASLRSDPQGGIHYVCAFTGGGDDVAQAEHACASGCTHTIEAAAEEDGTLVKKGSEPWVEMAPVPIGSTNIYYHSKPGSQNVLFLDFTGFVITNTRWNNNADYGNVAEWIARPYDLDGDETTFSDTEQQHIYQVWQRVAEDYAPFDINVTTEQPAEWNRWTAHALITPTTDANGVDLPHKGAGGVAYVNVFGGSSFSYDSANAYSPAFVTPMGAANTAEAASHEVGHNMGLSHDGTDSGGLVYYGGHVATASAPSWGPIMGTGYGQNVSQWSMGEYFDANQFQDDLTIIAGKTTYRPDDHGGTTATATELEPDGSLQIGTNGVIETTGDVDMFRFVTGAGTVNLTVETVRIGTGTWGGNLDAALLLYDGNGILLASNNPPAEVNASISTNLAEGIYFAAVVPVGAGDPFNATRSGYTVYGSLGQYTISGSVQASGDDIFLVAPNGGETWYRATTNTISWSAGFSGGVDITLYKGAGVDSVIASGVTNSGSYSWVIPGGQSRGNDYRVRVAQSSDPANFDESAGTFAIDEAPAIAYLIKEDFEDSGSLPVGWSQQVLAGSGSWAVQDGGRTGGANPSSAYSGVRNVTLYRQSTTDNRVRLRTPAFDAAGATNLVLRFQHHMEEWSPDQDFLNVYYSTNNGTDWNWLAGYSNSVAAWTLRELQLPSPGAGYVIGFEGNAKYGYGICLDDVEVLAYMDSGETEGYLSVTPVGDLSSSGHFGGAFTPVSQEYTLSNPGTNAIDWTAAKVADWISLSIASGTLAPEASTNVTVSINSNADTLVAGVHNDSIVFSNTTNGEGDTSRSVTLTVTVPDTPAGLVATPSLGKVDLSWGAAEAAASYRVKRAAVAEGPYDLIGSPEGTSYSDVGVTAGETYYYVISSLNGGGESADSAEVSATLPQALPFSETFDGPGMSSTLGAIDGQRGWQGGEGAVVVAVEGRSGSQALRLTDVSATNTFANGTNLVYVSTWMKSVGGEDPGSVAADASAVFWVDTNNYVRAYSNETIVVLPVQTNPADYSHFEVWVDYDAGTWRLDVNGTTAFSAFGTYSSQPNFTAIVFQNTAAEPAYFDDISISSGEAPPLTAFEQWLEGNGFAAETSGDTIASNGVNTLLEVYVAGLDPNDPQSRFEIASVGVPSGDFVFEWTGVSGRLYNVYWATNLMDGFSLWQSNVPWNATSITNSDHAGENQGYYRIEVQLEE